jgi:hypothetical protein
MPRFFLLFPLLAACGGGDLVSISRPDEPPEFCGDTGGASLSSDFTGTLTPGGCEYIVVAPNDDDTTRLVLDVPAFADALTDGSAEATYTLPDDAVRLTVEAGCNLDAAFCTDDIDGSATITSTYTPTAGTITVTATRVDGDSGNATVTVDLTFTGVELADESGDTVTIDTLTWTGLTLYQPLLG